MRISVVIPTLDEEARIGPLVRDLVARRSFHEVLVVDGGSTDATVRSAHEAGARVILAERGRATQLGAGAAAACGDVLLFLHADVRLPHDAEERIRRNLRGAAVAGAFRTRTVNDGARSWIEPLLPLCDLRASRTRLPYGDQALYVWRQAFEAVGGFPVQPLFEDLELARRLRRIGRIVVDPEPVQVSGRRFVARPFYFLAVMNLFPVLYRLGVPVDWLARFYGHPR